MSLRRLLVACALLLSPGVALADTGNPPPNGGGGTGGDPQVTPTPDPNGGCPPNTFEIGGVCIPNACSVRAPGAHGASDVSFIAAFAAAALLARRRRG